MITAYAIQDENQETVAHYHTMTEAALSLITWNQPGYKIVPVAGNWTQVPRGGKVHTVFIEHEDT